MPTLEDAPGSRANITLLRFLTAVRRACPLEELCVQLGNISETLEQVAMKPDLNAIVLQLGDFEDSIRRVLMRSCVGGVLGSTALAFVVAKFIC